MSPGKQVGIDIGHNPSTLSPAGIANEYTYNYGSASNDEVTVTETKNPKGLEGYIKCEHKPNNGATIKAIKYKNHGTNGLSGAVTHKTVTVYFWDKDTEYTNPLLLKLENDEKYYSSSDSKNWSNVNIPSTTLRQKLDEQNCTRNQAHQVDLSQNPTEKKTYTCLVSTCNVEISVKSKTSSGYSNYWHTINGISKFFVGKVEQTGIPASKGITGISVYLYPHSSGSPLLFYISSPVSKWFSRYVGENVWKNEDSLTQIPATEDKIPSNIQNLLQKLSTPKVTIDVSRSDSSAYQPEGDNTLTFNVRSTEYPSGSGFYKFTYTESNKTFKLQAVKHGGKTTLKGISSDEPLENVIAYYHGSDSLDKKKLLLVGLVSKDDRKNVYYSKPLVYGYSWTKLVRSDDQTTELTEEELKQILVTLKKTQFPEAPNVSPSLPSALTDTLKIGGSSLTTAGLGGLAVWKGPALLAKLIARL